jgi:hypothetical protein
VPGGCFFSFDRMIEYFNIVNAFIET